MIRSLNNLEEKIIINKLLEKYERSQHLVNPGNSNRRVMLQIEKGELKEYDFESASVKEAYENAAEKLETLGLISISWIKGIKRFDKLILNLDNIDNAYKFVGKQHPFQETTYYCKLIEKSVKDIVTAWIKNWANDVCNNMRQKYKLDPICKKGEEFLKKLLAAFSLYDTLSEDITMRAFSSKCYGNTKTFENEIRDAFVNIACKYDEDLSTLCFENDNFGIRDKLAYLGIYARPEIYELSGEFSLETENGKLDFSTIGNSGAVIRSTTVSIICSFDLSKINTIIFIENKTNYDESISSEKDSNVLVVYHGGFLSPQKRKFVEKIYESTNADTDFFFWADIDLGGFGMFYKLKEIIPSLKPMNMLAQYVEKYFEFGLKRNKTYLEKVNSAKANNTYPIFNDSIDSILQYGVTIEQEIFLLD